ncbi:MAG: ABC transporter ATP-binding protein [Nanoarchaeota archaeon]
MKNILEVRNLVKHYGKFTAVDGISFDVPKGKVIGFLGPNGAGKTTTIQVLLGITLANGGSVNYFGKDFFKNRSYCLQRINFTSSFNNLQGRTSVFENLLVYSYLYNVKNPRKKIKELIEYFEITSLINKRYYDLSSGQKTRVNIIKSLLNDPELILMDEPTASLDPDIADKVLTLIENLRKSKGISILYTSHDMEEVARICDEVIFLDKGKIIAKDTPLGLTKRISNAQLNVTFDADKNVVEKYLKTENLKYKFQTKNTVVIDSKENLIPKLIFSLSKEGIWMTDIEIKKPTLEDFFLQIARKKI